MDKLTRALEKARQKRLARLSSEHGGAGELLKGGTPNPDGTLPVDGDDPGSLPAPVRRSRIFHISDTQLEANRLISRRLQDRNADLFRVLRTKVMQEMGRIGARTLGVTSPVYGDGKSIIAANLALSLAQDVNQTVLLVDLDLRDPSVQRNFGIDAELGLGDYLKGDAQVPDCMVGLDIERLRLLPITHPLEDSSEVLGTPKMAALARELKNRYADRIVIYDMPPLLTQADTIAFLPHVDAVLLVLRDGGTTLEDFERCRDALANFHVVGAVINDRRFKLI
ncbi:CpsD/CapB family tyrosine-protein kinase [Phaeovibrio sulfidiphilus]|uniref:CpsD/CapB family tyrosine-protein kinase n=1 Tax=Phaeovibrio sulfidiphilus TaxID=1220600 RepID=A0A8J6YIM6_9PROT|nr:CpsD/CapB family tyrosine-protein kinase [Phaeovibrio sulfidiphilus]MBE1236951.1 CpsD/CapB family tyrosine-protein kinase [Phaeovibrio sulfidiphilus]